MTNSSILDSEVSMHRHVEKLLSFGFFHLHRLHQFRWMHELLPQQRYVSTFILLRIDFCNAVLAGLPAFTLKPLQRILNAAAWAITSLASVC